MSLIHGLIVVQQCLRDCFVSAQLHTFNNDILTQDTRKSVVLHYNTHSQRSLYFDTFLVYTIYTSTKSQFQRYFPYGLHNNTAIKLAMYSNRPELTSANRKTIKGTSEHLKNKALLLYKCFTQSLLATKRLIRYDRVW